LASECSDTLGTACRKNDAVALPLERVLRKKPICFVVVDDENRYSMGLRHISSSS
jgi:hypothetical protein